jgi:hypothetical protein
MKICPASLSFRRMQTKTTISYHLISVRMTIIKKKNAPENYKSETVTQTCSVVPATQEAEAGESLQPGIQQHPRQHSQSLSQY